MGILSVFSVMRTNKYHIDCKGEPCLWWWQPWLPHLQLLHWAVSSGTVSEIPDLWAVAGGCQWKEKMSREIFLFYPPVPKRVAFFFFFFLPIYFGLTSGPQSKDHKWLVRWGKEGAMSTACPAVHAVGSLSCPPGRGCPCHPIPVGGFSY